MSKSEAIYPGDCPPPEDTIEEAHERLQRDLRRKETENQALKKDLEHKEKEASGNSIRWGGHGWIVQFEGNFKVLPDHDGLDDFARLVGRPGYQFSPEDFFQMSTGGVSQEAAQEAELNALSSCQDESSDDPAVEAYKQELIELQQDLAEARKKNDPRLPALQEEFWRLSEHLKSEEAARKRGRKRTFGASPEKKRMHQTIRMRLTRVRELFRHNMPELVSHLETHLHMDGGVFSYGRPGESLPAWHVQLLSSTAKK